MKKMIIIPAFLLFVICFYGCPFHYGYDHPNGKIPETPVNITNANSEFDDINMTSPELNEETLLIFSTNRKSSGGNFDLISHPISFHWDKREGNFYTTDDTLPEFAYLDQFIGLANTTGNEYGPFSFFQNIYGNNQYSERQYLFYSSDISGTNNINWMSYKFNNMRSYSSQFVPDSVSGPFEIPFLNNKGFDEMYFTLKMSPWINGYNSFPTDNVIESIIYCDNSLGDFNLYSIDIPSNIPFYSFIKKEDGVSKVELTTLNSESNDRCPYVCGDFMVFSSDRPGGLGGYDLYWSIYENGQWKTPVNFGAPVNSSSNEFRAIVNYAFEFDNQLLIFSSDRLGGKGGYDLYYVGIDVMPDVSN
jgi:hypothetical protein